MSQRINSKSGIILLPLFLMVMGFVLLLWNFLLLDFFNPTSLLWLLLVVVGVQVLLKGDFIPQAESRTFGITRGSVEEATLEISAGDIDVVLDALPPDQAERLIAGQYAPQARPVLDVDGTRAQLVFERHQTAWSALVDWMMGLARDLPWKIYIYTNTGQIKADLSAVITDQLALASGLGDIHLTVPCEAFNPLSVTSTMGTIHIITPARYRNRVDVRCGRLSSLHVDNTRYQQDEDGFYVAKDADDDYLEVQIIVECLHGDVYLA